MRAIDADAFKNYIRSGYEEMKHLFNENLKVATLVTESFCKDIDEQPTIQPEPHWIPVTERLPEIGEYVLCMIRQKYRGQFHVCQYVDKDKYRNHPYFDWWHNGFPDVIAWMPLPEPYKGVTT